MLAYCTQGQKDPNVVVYATRTADAKINVVIGHVFTVQNSKVAMAITGTVRQVYAELPPHERVLPNESPYQFLQGLSVAADTKTFDALYLGFVRVKKQEGSKVIKKAAEINATARAKMQMERETRGVRRASLLRGGAAAFQLGAAVEEDPVTIVVTPRSLRILDRLAGETIFKFLLPTITYATSSKGSKHDTFGCVVHNDRLGVTNCHLFYTACGSGAALGQAVAQAINEYKRRFGGLHISGNPWDVAANAIREAAPDALFAKQVHRNDLKALSIIGAGEYGEVYLAFQTVEGRTPEHKEISVTVPRAVKMMKSAATQQVKDEYCREAITMLKIGDHDNIVRLIGVAVQQAPWLMVLEFVQFGDLRAVLQACKENSIELSVGEMLSFMRQLATGCAHISARRIVHMDLAARNVLLGPNNQVKIGDFGMAREMAADGDYIILREKIPLALKWNSIEAMDSRFFSEASDCWSYGVMTWEILTYGEFPYQGIPMEDVQSMVRAGLRLVQPQNCPDELWSIVSRCWSVQIKDRWRFANLMTLLVKEEDRLSQGSAARDVGITVAGGALPLWSQHVEAGGASGGSGGSKPGTQVSHASPKTTKRDGGLGSLRREIAPPASPLRNALSFKSSPRGSPSGRHGKPPASPKVKRGKSMAAKGSPKGSPQRSNSLDPNNQMRHLDFASMPNFNSGSGRVKAQGQLRGKLPF